jgi:3-oxoacyl-[acyl-carrier protein] reductase
MIFFYSILGRSTKISTKENTMTNSNSTPSRLAGKVALVSGGSRGIGRATAIRLGADGAAVAINYVSNEAAALEVVAEIHAGGGRAVALQGDFSNLAEIRGVFDGVESNLGRPDIVVLAPGAFLMKPLAFVTEEEFDKVFALNTKGVFFALQEAAKRINNNGAIVSLSSGATSAPGAAGSVYAGSKAAAEQFTFALARELGDRGISVNSVSPSITNTDGLVVPPHIIDMLKQRIPFGRIGEPDDIANVIAFMVSPDGHWINAQNVRANGGLV